MSKAALPVMTCWYPATINPVRVGMYRVQDSTLSCNCCWMSARWNGSEWFSNLHSPPGYHTTHMFDVKRWRGMAAKGAKS